MGLRINTNVASINGQRNLRGTNLDMRKAMERLSSGYRINHAGDDAAGLAISENLRAQIRGYQMNIRNSEDGISLVQVAEGGLTETGNILVRLRELAIQAASDTLGQDERGFLDVEYQQQVQEPPESCSRPCSMRSTWCLHQRDHQDQKQYRVECRIFRRQLHRDAQQELRVKLLGQPAH